MGENKGGLLCPLFSLSLPSPVSHLFVLFLIKRVFASVITAPAKWAASVCAAFQTESASGRGAWSLRRVTSIGCPLLLANSGASWERAREKEARQTERKRFSPNVFVWRRVTRPSLLARHRGRAGLSHPNSTSTFPTVGTLQLPVLRRGQSQNQFAT